MKRSNLLVQPKNIEAPFRHLLLYNEQLRHHHLGQKTLTVSVLESPISIKCAC